MRSSKNGGYDFAADPNLPAPKARALWDPRIDPSVVVLQKVPESLSGAAEPTILPEGNITYAHDGLHHLLGVGGQRRLQVLQSDPDAGALVAIIPLDQDGFARLDAVFRLLAQLHGRVVPDDKRLTSQKRLRAKRMLQAYDGRLAGASQRDCQSDLSANPGHPGRVAKRAGALRHRGPNLPPMSGGLTDPTEAFHATRSRSPAATLSADQGGRAVPQPIRPHPRKAPHLRHGSGLS
ncbi:MAG: DUF2285 domain-containing protein [Pseudomonadota bacterium]